MAARLPNWLRNQAVTQFREQVCARLGVAPFPHQREVWSAMDGWELQYGQQDPNGVTVNVSTDKGSVDIQKWAVTPRLVNGAQTHARFGTDLGSFKIGKSYGAALWGSGFAIIPDARIKLIGLEYDICEPEFSYLEEFLLSERGMNLRAVSDINRPREGKMFLELESGARYEAKSWERKDSLKGKEDDAYIYCEAYMLPGVECFTSYSQNLRIREGFAYFPTTPDRPWVKELHKLGWNHHGPDGDPEWHCTCDIPADANVYAFDAKAKERDRKLMTKEKFSIHYEGKIGNFIGHVFNYTLGTHQFRADTHPFLFRNGITDRAHLVIPDGWTIIGGADTGTFYSAGLVAFSPDGDAFVIEEFPNYEYVAGTPERDELVTVPGWARSVVKTALEIGGRSGFWADPNSQFKGELRNYGMSLLPARVPVETRTEILREYFEHRKIWIAPWLSVLPFEIENAAWPEEATSTGRFARIKDRDHSLDWLEHIVARRPLGRVPESAKGGRTWAESMGYRRPYQGGNPHLGRN